MVGHESERSLSPEAIALGYPGKRWTKAELRAMSPELAKKFLPPQARELYQRTPTRLLDNPVPLERNPAINANHERARELLGISIYQARKNERLLFVSVVGAMASGKSTAMCDALSGHEFPLVTDWTYAVFKHIKQIEYDGQKIITHGKLEFLEVKPYDNIFSILEQVEEEPPEVIIAEEAQFAFIDKERSEGTIKQEISGFLGIAREMRVKAVIFTSLDFDFKREPWPHMRPMLGLVDLNLVVTARCVDCNGIAYFTQRDVFENGVWRPARVDEDIVVVGNVGEGNRIDKEDVYRPKCVFCHQVLPPRGGQ
ncbi:MAG: hypothetical protein LiPW16_279 [Microgenomates group bacterium LiPW_16]|nr:MAG: hypothetical protein LiPW16_279 [Microgenomates group bacterium LiPW_16]